MKFHFIIFTLFLFSISAFCDISDNVKKSMQDDADESLFVTIIKTVYDTTETSYGEIVVKCTVQALVDSVFRSNNGLSVDDTVKIIYHLYENWGQISSPYVLLGHYVPAFLNWNVKGYFEPAANNASFYYINLSDEQEKYPIVNDSLWMVFKKSGHNDSTFIGNYALKKEKNNLLFYCDDTLVLRCYNFMKSLYPSRRISHPLQPTFGTSRQGGSIISFAIEGKPDDSLVLVLPDEKTAALDKRMNLYSKGIEICNSGHDYVSQRSLLKIWGENRYRTALISHGENKVVIKGGYGLTIFLNSISKEISLLEISENEPTQFLDSLCCIECKSWGTTPIIGNLDIRLDSISDSVAYMNTRQFGPDMPILERVTAKVGDTLNFNDPVTDDALSLTIMEFYIDTNWHYDIEYVFFKRLKCGAEVDITTPIKSNLSLSKKKSDLAVISINGRVVYSGYHSLSEVKSVIPSLQLANGIYFIRQNLKYGKYLGKIRVE